MLDGWMTRLMRNPQDSFGQNSSALFIWQKRVFAHMGLRTDQQLSGQVPSFILSMDRTSALTGAKHASQVIIVRYE